MTNFCETQSVISTEQLEDNLANLNKVSGVENSMLTHITEDKKPVYNVGFYYVGTDDHGYILKRTVHNSGLFQTVNIKGGGISINEMYKYIDGIIVCLEMVAA